MNFTVVLLISGSITFLVALLFLQAARNLGRLRLFRDYPDNIRKHHRRPIPATGGLALAAATGIGAFMLFPLVAGHVSEGMAGFAIYFAAGAFMIVFAGIYDDLLGLSFKPKFIMQLLAAAIVLWGLETQFVAEHIHYSQVPIAARIGVYVILGIWIVSGCNTINLVDGIDALAGSLSLTALAGIAAIGISWGVMDVFPVIVPMAAAILGFLWFNRPPAAIFMGDTGSMFSGFVLTTTIIVLAMHAHHWMYTLSLALLLSIPLTDTIFAIIRRVKCNLNPFESDSNHLHHMLQRYFQGPGYAVVTLSSASLVMIGISVYLSTLQSATMFFSIYGVLFVLFLIFAGVYSVRIQKKNSMFYLLSSHPGLLKPYENGQAEHDKTPENVPVGRFEKVAYRDLD